MPLPVQINNIAKSVFEHDDALLSMGEKHTNLKITMPISEGIMIQNEWTALSLFGTASGRVKDACCVNAC